MHIKVLDIQFIVMNIVIYVVVSQEVIKQLDKKLKKKLEKKLKISQAIKELQKILEQNGDLDLCIHDYEVDSHFIIERFNVDKKITFINFLKQKKEKFDIVSIETI